jgi:hypothetical protein
VRREGEGGACAALTSHRHLHGASGQLVAGVGSAGGGVAVAMGGVWVWVRGAARGVIAQADLCETALGAALSRVIHRLTGARSFGEVSLSLFVVAIVVSF